MPDRNKTDSEGANSTARRGQMGGTKPGSGPSGNCICPNCGYSQPHERGKPCNEINCPKCKTRMVRE